MSEPVASLKARHAAEFTDETHRYYIITYDDGSVWRKCGKNWFCVWQPEPVVVAWADPTAKPTEACPSEETIEFKANPKPFVFKPGLTIRSIDDIQRIAALETELRITKERFDAVKAHAEDVGDRCKRAQERANAWERAANKGSQASITSPKGLETRIEVYEEQIEELKKDQTVATPDLPKTMTVDELRVWDDIWIPRSGKTITSVEFTSAVSGGVSRIRTVGSSYGRDFIEWALARGVQVYRDGKLISGWPVGEEPSGGNAGRVDWLEQNIRTWEKNAAIDHNTIKELKTELATANAKFDVSEAHALEAIERAKKAESELAAAKNRVTEWANAAFSSSDFDAYERTPDGLKKKIAAIKSQKQEAALDPILSKQRVYATLLGVLREMQTDSAYGTYKTGLIQAAITALEYLFGHVTPNSCPSYRVQ